jgi:hypothetical protein
MLCWSPNLQSLLVRFLAVVGSRNHAHWGLTFCVFEVYWVSKDGVGRYLPIKSAASGTKRKSRTPLRHFTVGARSTLDITITHPAPPAHDINRLCLCPHTERDRKRGTGRLYLDGLISRVSLENGHKGHSSQFTQNFILLWHAFEAQPAQKSWFTI